MAIRPPDGLQSAADVREMKRAERRRERELEKQERQAQKKRQRDAAQRQRAERIVELRRQGKTWTQAARDVGFTNPGSAWTLVDVYIGDAASFKRNDS